MNINNSNGPLGPVDPNFDFSKTEPLETFSGDALWQSGFILRKVPKEVSGMDQDTVIPVQVFYDPKTGKILDNMLPPTLREELTGVSIESSTEQPTQPNQWEPSPENSPFQWEDSSEKENNNNSPTNFSWGN